MVNRNNVKTILSISMVTGLLWLAPLAIAFAQPAHRPPRVPEIDPALAISGLAMLGGGILLIADRFRRRRQH
jgi:hypothetical protein